MDNKIQIIQFPEFEVSVYEDDAKFLDLIPTMIPQTIQSAFCTLICMFLVCLLFIRQPTAVIVANFSIFSTCAGKRYVCWYFNCLLIAGVFGILSLWGVELDPIVLSSCIMSIGFSVDIPGHIVYHFTKHGKCRPSKMNTTGYLGTGDKAQLSIEERLKECLGSIVFPILEAGFSTIICVLSLTFVELHMANVFVKTMVLVVALSLVHGILIIPVMLYLISLIPFGQTFTISPEPAIEKTERSIKPISLEVNLKM